MKAPDCSQQAERLNAACQCRSLDRERLRVELEHASPGFFAEIVEGRPHMFADSMVFVGERDVERMAAIVAAVERVVALPAYCEHVLAGAPAAARVESAARGVFFGYDFHLSADGPKLIEINTNAGGALLNAILERAQVACCDEVRAATRASLAGSLGGDTPEHLFMEMFRAEWRAVRGDAPLAAIAIVDDDPAAQYLHPEFVLFQRLFARYGVAAVICDPRELMICHGGLWHEQTKIDLVYNRLTDFALEQPAHEALRRAWCDGAAVVTPHPRVHALYADKRNLVALGDDALLARWGVDAETRAVLALGVPRTEVVDPANADDLWARRKQLFFKPAAGYGSKAAYRGDRITKRVFAEVMAGNYIAQELVVPSSRLVQVDGESVELKLDLRNYVYDGCVQLVAARLWQGQTTNFRTPGGGFATVLAVPCKENE